MKKLFSLLICLFLVSMVFGQWRVGPRAGVNFSTLTGKWNDNDSSKTSWIAGPVGGAVGNYSFNDKFSLSGELLYITMGRITESTYGERSGNSTAITFTERERYNCLHMAVLTRIMFVGTCISPYFSFGPFLTQKFGGVYIIDDGTNVYTYRITWRDPQSRSSSDKYYVNPDYNRRIDLGMYVGGGAGKDLGPGRLELDLRFGYGLLDLNKFESKDDRKDARDNGYKPYHSMKISLTMAYLFDLSKK